MNTGLNPRIVRVASIMLIFGLACPGIASARRIWNQGQNIHPQLAQCSVEKAARDRAFMSWDICMGGQINPPPAYDANGGAHYWLRLRKCRSKYNMYTNAKHRYETCETRPKYGRHGR